MLNVIKWKMNWNTGKHGWQRTNFYYIRGFFNNIHNQIKNGEITLAGESQKKETCYLSKEKPQISLVI